MTTSHGQCNLRHAMIGGLAALVLVLATAVPTTAADAPARPGYPRRVHIVRGLWYHDYRIEEALARLGGSAIEESWHASSWGFGQPGTWASRYSSHVEGLPANARALAANAGIVVCNINGNALGAKRAKALEAYARDGGHVIFLGGRYAFGKEYRNVMGDWLPVTFKDGMDLVHAPTGLALVATPAASLALRSLAWDASPRVYWYHDVSPRADARVLICAGNVPLLMQRQVGRGRVTVFAGSVMGDPPPDTVPFWKWPDWSLCLAEVLREVQGAGAGAAVETNASDKDEADLFDTEATADAMADVVAVALRGCRDGEQAMQVLETLLLADADLAPEQVDPLADAMLPWIDDSFAETGLALVGESRPNIACVGLRVLAASGHVRAVGIAEQAWEDGSIKGQNTDEAAPMGLLSAGGAPNLMSVAPVRPTALVALGDAQSDAALTVARQAVAKTADGRFGADSKAQMLTDRNRLYQAAVLAALRCGDEQMADPVVGFLLENVYVLARARTWSTSIPDYEPTFRKVLPQTKAWQQGLYRKLPFVPDAVLPALARRIAREETWRITPIAFGFFSGKTLSPEVREELSRSPVSAVAAFARQANR